jgi:hypothetical protein
LVDADFSLQPHRPSDTRLTIRTAEIRRFMGKTFS